MFGSRVKNLSSSEQVVYLTACAALALDGWKYALESKGLQPNTYLSVFSLNGFIEQEEEEFHVLYHLVAGEFKIS